MKVEKIRHILFLIAMMLFVLPTQATEVTYHILTLPIDPSRYDYHMQSDLTGKRLEAAKITVTQSKVELPAEYKSPLATNFRYYSKSDVNVSASAVKIFENYNNLKGFHYQVKGIDTADPTPSPVAEGTTPPEGKVDYYVIYDYNEANSIVQLDGSVKYNIHTKGRSKTTDPFKNKGFMALNRGRNNRPAIIPTDRVNPEMLASEDFMKVADLSPSKVNPYWKDGNNKNKEAAVASQFHFIFKFEGKDPYNIIMVNAYAKDSTYIEKLENENKFVYKWYKGGALIAPNNGGNAYLVSDAHIKYKTPWVDGAPNPIDPAYDSYEGYLHGNNCIWGSLALLNNSDNSGYIFMGTRTADANGVTPNEPYYLKEKDTYNNLCFTQSNSSNNLSIEGLYPLKKVTFKVPTPFYAIEATEAHIVSAADYVSQYTVENDPIETKYLPASLRRKYCGWTGKFYSDAARTQQITHFSQAHYDNTEGYQVYLGYTVSATIPFQAITPSASYTTATWYELTDAGSTQEYGRKIKYDGTSAYKNNGAAGEYTKESEFAFVGDPYELKVLHRQQTETASANRYVTLSTYDSWDIPVDEVDEVFLLRKFNDAGYWYWDAGQPTGAVAYQSNLAYSTGEEAQTITFTVSGLDGSKYIKVTTGGTDAAQIVSVTPAVNTVVPETGTSATVTVRLAANTGEVAKTMSVTIQEYTDDHGITPSGTPSVITITQGTSSSSFAGNTVDYSATNSTYVKALDLPKFSYTYNIVDKSGRIAVKASASQTIFSSLSLASIPSIIISPFLVGENVTFYDSFNNGSGAGTGTSRTHLSGSITETPNAAADIYVKYTTATLDAKPFKLSEDQEIFVRLNGHYIYYEDGVIKSAATSQVTDAYKWKLRNRDPYAMLIDNMQARVALSVAGQSESVTIYDDNGGTTSESRQKGAWVDLAAIENAGALTFITNRLDAQRFIAKSSARAGVYEVMVATGSGVDASTTYYNIGRPADNTVRIYDNATYRATIDDEIKFRLEENTDYTYHLIDKARHELLTITSKSPEMVLPAEYQSPLVGAANYSYYAPDNITISGDTYTPTDPAAKLSSLSGLEATFTATSGDYATAWENADAAHKMIATDEADMNAQAKKLTATGDYYCQVGGSTYYQITVTKPCYYDIYVTYTTNDLIGFNNTGRVNDHPYLLRFLNPFAEGYFLEDGNDKLTGSKIQAIYPYCNGDGNLNIYGLEMRDEQMNGGSSTRPRWVWFFESANEDPYHVRIHSRSTISYNSISNPTYLETKAVRFNQDVDPAAAKHVVTGGSLPGVASEPPTEYMILGTPGAFRLTTTDPIDDGATNVRRTVTSFEQYWKTYNMLKLHVLGISASTDAYSDDEATWVVPADKRTELNTRLEELGIGSGKWHSYPAYANAVRWNGYNDKSDGHEKKIVERLEHWFQTFDMGNGTFDIEDADIPPVLVLLDQHGWEIMRRPLPAAHYPEGADELAALRVYDSPLVKEYKFYSQATKATGCHKYTLRMQNGAERDQIKVNGTHYTSTSLADLPPITASGVMSNGMLNDQFVTYTVKEEYDLSYEYSLSYTGDATEGYTITSETGTAQPYLVLQNGRFYKTENSKSNPLNPSYITKPIIEHTDPEGGNIYDLIIKPHNHGGSNDNIINGGNFIRNNFWYVKPNMRIDEEMGIKWGAANSGAEPLTENATKVTYKDKSGFDPYNMQLQLVNKNDGTPDGRYLTTHMTSARLENGIMVGNYTGSGGTMKMTLESGFTSYDPTVDRGSEGYDHTNLQISNQTFMAVSDANGNMQLMPRFDHTQRVTLANVSPWETQLSEPVNHAKAKADDNSSMGPQTTFFVHPQRFIYHIIDNSGKEAIRYVRGGDDYPTITEHFKSPLATDFTYYTDLALTDQITGSFEAKNLFSVDNHVYVRYSYDEEADKEADRILQGQWFTVQLDGKDVQAEGVVVPTEGATQGTGVSLYSGTKPATIDATEKEWQWKFLATPSDPTSPYYVAPDPYSVNIFNRSANYSATLTEPNPMGVPIKVPNANNGADRFVLLSHPSGGYALAVAKEYLDYNYQFLNGENMTAPDAGSPVGATTASEASFTYKSGAISNDAQVLLEDDVTYRYTYHVINNAAHLAASAEQDNDEAESNNYAPKIPTSIKSPLLKQEDYLYYGSASESSGTYAVVDATKLFTLYGLYDDVVYVRYNAYDPDSTEFQVPNKKTIVDSHVARDEGSHDVSMNINGGLPYNIIWYNDNMMQSTDNTTITDGGSHALDGNEKYVWYFTGNDPYALKIKHKNGSYVNGTASLVAEGSATEFMLLEKEGYDYGVLQVSKTMGAPAGKKLTGFGAALTPDAATDPTQFIIFGLSVHDLIYRMIIAKTCPDKTNPQSDEYVAIPYRTGDENTYTESDTWLATDTLWIFGTTQRDLTSAQSGVPGDKYQLGTTLTWGGNSHTYCHDAGTVSIGDDLWVPNEFYRPNCTFEFFIEGVYNEAGTTPEADLNNRFKGLKLDKLMSASELIDKTVVVNIVYKFDQTLATNTGLGFVTSTAQNLWYTFETPSGVTPYLAHYTNAWGLQCMAGRETRYTNDYLWTPLGDVFGFKMYNRYMLKNSGGVHNVMTYAGDAAENKSLLMAEAGTGDYTAGNEIFELISGDQEGNFRVHPVVNNSGTQYYVRRDPTDDYIKLSTTPADWRFGLDMYLFEPYYDRAGYVGGLTAEGKAAYEAAVATEKIIEIQNVVYNDANIVPFTSGYYRLHNQPGVSSISPVRYVSGYLHDIEKTAVSGGIPMHFYSKAGVSSTYTGEEGLISGFTVTNATRGDIPIDPTEYDPSTIFYMQGGIDPSDPIDTHNPRVTLQTQGLYVAANANGDAENGTTTSKLQRAVMSANAGDAITFSAMDIGGAVLLIHDGATPATRRYLNYDQTDAAGIYDLRYYHESPVDDAKWCLQPVQKSSSAGNGEMPLMLTTNNGGDGYYYATFYAPFDVLLPADGGGKTYNAYTCKKWHDEGVNPKAVPVNGVHPEGKFVPAGTPVIIRTNDESESLTLSLPTEMPSAEPLSCIFTGSYLEQLLPLDADHDVYTLGLPMTSEVSKAADYETSGGIIAPLPEFANTGVGFYINATRNKESDALEALWTRNNRYVLHNKIYYRAAGGSPAPERNARPEFVPVLFGDEEQPGMQEEKNSRRFDGGVYDLLGRKVADEQAAKDGTWRYRLSPGVYIVNGQKVMCSY